MTADEALRHPWVVNEGQESVSANHYDVLRKQKNCCCDDSKPLFTLLPPRRGFFGCQRKSASLD